MTKSRSAVNHGIPSTDRAVQSSKDENSRAGLATFRDHTKDRNVICDRPYLWLTAPDNLPLLRTLEVTLTESLSVSRRKR